MGFNFNRISIFRKEDQKMCTTSKKLSIYCSIMTSYSVILCLDFYEKTLNAKVCVCEGVILERER